MNGGVIWVGGGGVEILGLVPINRLELQPARVFLDKGVPNGPPVAEFVGGGGGI